MKLIRTLILLLLILLPLSAASVVNEGLSGGFASEENLKRFDFASESSDEYTNVEINLLTQSPGEAVYTWFGHTSLEVSIPSYLDRDYNWGVFAFSASFYKDFAFGRLFYSLMANDMAYSIFKAEYEERELRSLELNLTPSAKKSVIDFLNLNSKSENQHYLYHYYLDNCATRVRDIYNAATIGEFKAWAEGINTHKSFRDYTTDYMSDKSFIVSWTLNALQGPAIDKKINLYEACFMPDVLESAIEEFQKSKSIVIVESPEKIKAPISNDLLISSLLIGLTIAIFIYTEERHRIRVWGLLTFIFNLFLSILSLVFLFFMLFTNHDVTFFNENIIFINPLLLIPAFQGLLTLIRKKDRGHRGTTITYRILTLLTIVLLIFKGLFPSFFIQENFSAMFLVLPLYILGSLAKTKGGHQEKRPAKG